MGLSCCNAVVVKKEELMLAEAGVCWVAGVRVLKCNKGQYQLPNSLSNYNVQFNVQLTVAYDSITAV